MWFFITASTGQSSEKQSLPILVLLPYPDQRDDSGWDRGLELLPAARLAVKEINNNSKILPDHEIQLIERSSDGCGRSVIINGLSNFAGNALQRGPNTTNAIAVIGLACSTVTASVSPLAGREGVDLLQMAMSISEIFRDKITYRHLWRVLPSSSVFVSTTIALMERFHWTRVAQIFDGNGVLFQTTADDFRNRVKSNSSYTLLVDQAIDEGDSFIQSALDLIQNAGARIIFVSVTLPESVKLLCAAAKRNLIWPGYVWILYTRTLEEFINNAVCDLEILIPAIENVTLLDLPLQGRDLDDVLVSGRTYREYLDEYDTEVATLSGEDEFQQYLSDFTFVNNRFANPMYDEVWALALAIDSSLPELEVRNLSLEDYEYNNIAITNIIEDHLKSVSFAGAVTEINFDRNNREAVTPINILQIRNGKNVMIGRYNGLQNDLSMWNISEESIPSDDFVVRYKTLNEAYAISVYIVGSLLFIFITVMLILTLALHTTPEVRASSPLLNLLIFFGCYQLLFGSVFAVTRQFIQLDATSYVVLCYFEVWSIRSGVNVITATMLMRLIRIYRIFTHFGKTGKIWQNRYLFIFILLIACSPEVLMMIISILVDPLGYQEQVTYLLNENPPAKLIFRECSGDYQFIFDVLGFLYTGILIFLLVVFAIRSRKIGYKNFNDTKKINGFVFSFTFIGIMFLSVNRILHSLNRENDATMVTVASLQVLSFLTQMFLIFPKAVPAFYHQLHKNQSPTGAIVSSSTAKTILLSLKS